MNLNPTKCQFGKTELKFLGHLINDKGIQPDPDKIAAISEMPPTTCIQELKCFMGMVRHLGKFSRNLAELSQPLRELLTKIIHGDGTVRRTKHLNKLRQSYLNQQFWPFMMWMQT